MVTPLTDGDTTHKCHTTAIYWTHTVNQVLITPSSCTMVSN